jgi:hypothetical protein
MFPPSSNEEVLERNMLDALESVPLDSESMKEATTKHSRLLSGLFLSAVDFNDVVR